MNQTQIPMFLDHVDILQVGARNMQNFDLLKELSKIRRPVLLKRGPAATIEEWLLSAEYIMMGGNHDVILCERGIRTFENYTRNTLDISAIPVVKKLSHLPVLVDPSHGTGRRDKVSPMARAAVAAGADGLLIEVHHAPETALCDGAQSLYPEQFGELMSQLKIIAPAVQRRMM
jgi:3-deoxy-7-phosphoheptulonate synthase